MKAITTLGGDTKLLLNISACKIIGLLGCKKSRSFPIIYYQSYNLSIPIMRQLYFAIRRQAIESIASFTFE